MYLKNGFLLVQNSILGDIKLHLCKLDQGCHGQGKTRIFQGQEKVRKLFKKLVKIFDIVKVSEKSGNSVLWFIQFISFLQDLEMRFLSEKMKSMLQSKQSDQFDTLHLTHVVVVVSGFRCECFLPNSFFLFPQKAERG